MTTAFHPLRPLTQPARGASLVELMVAILIGSMVLAGVMIITLGSSSIGRRSDSLGGLTDTGQVALQLLASEVRMAGYSVPRAYYTPGYVTKMLPTSGIRGCDNGFTSAASADWATLACRAAVNAAGGGLAIAYEADAFNSVMVNGGGGAAPSDCRGFGLLPSVDGIGNEARPAVAEDSMTASAYWRVENRYFIGPAGTDNEPSLLCTGSGGGDPFSTTITLIRGVERMVVTFGIAQGVVDPSRNDTVMIIDNPSVINYMTAAQIDNNPAWAGEPAAVRWQRVVSARVCLVTRGAEFSAEPGASYVDCAGAVTNITDRRARRAVRMTMNLRNRTLSVDETTGIGMGGV